MLTRVDYDYVAELEAKVKELREYERGWAKPHVWNFIAKTLREAYATGFDDEAFIRGSNRTIEILAVKFAKRFEKEDGFDPVTFLDHCSPNPELYPFSELWEND